MGVGDYAQTEVIGWGASLEDVLPTATREHVHQTGAIVPILYLTLCFSFNLSFKHRV